jgi:hypothetical protein
VLKISFEDRTVPFFKKRLVTMPRTALLTISPMTRPSPTELIELQVKALHSSL